MSAGRYGAAAKRARQSAIGAPLVVALLALTSGAIGPAGATSPRTLTTASTAAGSAQVASSALAAASASLRSGAGPAGGSSVTCRSGSGSVSCSSAGSAAPLPAAARNSAIQPATSSSGNWSQVAIAPGGRYSAMMTYDLADKEVVLFGGYNGTSASNYGDTWVYASNGWTHLYPAKSPPARYGGMMAYDYKDKYVVLFGGISLSTGVLADTWTFVHGKWTKLSPTHSPPALYGATMAWDANDSELVLFGGLTGASLTPSTTWTFVGGSWTRLTPSVSPPGRWAAQMAYDNANGWIVLFGGDNATTGLLGDTWNFSHGHWTNVHPAQSPPYDDLGTLGNDTADGELVLSGGITNGTWLSSTWTFANRTWTHIGPAQSPPDSEGAVSTYDKQTNALLVFGGWYPSPFGSTYLNDLWSFHAGAWNPDLVAAPPHRENAVMTWDGADGYVLLFGGQVYPYSYGTTTIANDTWSYVHGVWKEIKTKVAPPARYGAAMAYDATDGYVVLFGGVSAAYTGLNDTWTYVGGKWTELFPSTHPSARSLASMTYDAADGYLLLFGGYAYVPTYSGGYYSDLNDTWSFSGGAWTNVISEPCTHRGCPLAPPGSEQAVLVYDAADGYVVDFGGTNSTLGMILPYTWAYRGGVWANLTAYYGGPIPGGRGIYGSAAAYDGYDGTVLLYGGINSSAVVTQTWQFSGGYWSLLSPKVTPSLSVWGAAAYDPTDQELVMELGLSSGYTSQTWVYTG